MSASTKYDYQGPHQEADDNSKSRDFRLYELLFVNEQHYFIQSYKLYILRWILLRPNLVCILVSKFLVLFLNNQHNLSPSTFTCDLVF